MSAVNSLSVVGKSHTDGTTARTHVFSKEANLPGGLRFRDTSEAVYSLSPRLNVTAKTPSGASRVIRLKTTYTTPYTDGITPDIIGTVTCNLEIIVPVNTPEAVRKDVGETLRTLLATTTFRNQYEALDFMS